MNFDDLGLDPRLLAAVNSMGYTSPTPIQQQAIPFVLDGRDVVGVAQTGTGKTAAFVLPMLQRIPAKPGGIRALVVTPTRELAVQIEGVAREVSKHTRHRIAVVYGGVGYEPQKRALKKGIDILVACPGRLLDLVSQGDCDLSSVQTLVLDEADRMLDMGFWPDVKRIINLLPESRQNLLFSATMSPEVLKIIDSTLTDPAKVQVTPESTPVEKIAQSLYPVGASDKTDLLLSIVKDHGLKRVLVFTRTKHRADRVARVLGKAGIRGAAIHGNRSQAQRQTALESFRRGDVHVLVATDVVSRGIDIDDITHVVNFDLPNMPADYVHRIGRTARAGRSGTAISLLAPEEHEQLRDIEKTIGATISCEDHPGFAYREQRDIPDPERSASAPAPKQGSKKGKRRSGGRRAGSGAPGSGQGGGGRSAGGQSGGGDRSGSQGSSRSGGSQPLQTVGDVGKKSAQPPRDGRAAGERKGNRDGQASGDRKQSRGGQPSGDRKPNRDGQASGDRKQGRGRQASSSEPKAAQDRQPRQQQPSSTPAERRVRRRRRPGQGE